MSKKSYIQTRQEHTELLKSLYNFMLGSDGFMVKYNFVKKINEFDFGVHDEKQNIHIYCHCETDNTGKLTLTIDDKNVFPTSLTVYPEHLKNDGTLIPDKTVYNYLKGLLIND